MANLIPLTQAIKKSGLTEKYILHIVDKGRVSYAKDNYDIAMLVDIDDIMYHKEQVRLLSLTQEQLIKAKAVAMMTEREFPTAIINHTKMIKVAKSTKVLK